MKHDPISGPIPRAEFTALIAAPHGEAIKVIRKYDPLFGREAGEKIKWRVTYRRKAWETGRAMVEAKTLKEAQKLADDMDGRQIDWEPTYSSDDAGDVESIEPDEEQTHPIQASSL